MQQKGEIGWARKLRGAIVAAVYRVVALFDVCDSGLDGGRVQVGSRRRKRFIRRQGIKQGGILGLDLGAPLPLKRKLCV